MKAIHNRAFQKVVECPTCGAPLEIENTPSRVIQRCSEDARHYITSGLRLHAAPVSEPRKRPQWIVDDEEIERAEREAIRAEGCGELEPDEVLAKTAELPKPLKVTISTAQPIITPPATTATIFSSPPIETPAFSAPKTEPNFNETLTELDASPEPENLRKPKIAPDAAAPIKHGFGSAYGGWSFPTASGASSYAPKDAKQ